jgi:hypothetical protein
LEEDRLVKSKLISINLLLIECDFLYETYRVGRLIDRVMCKPAWIVAFHEVCKLSVVSALISFVEDLKRRFASLKRSLRAVLMFVETSSYAAL